MMGYPGLDELEVSIRSGRGIAIILEGQSYEEDYWFYGHWFGGLAQKVTFFPQDGWLRVQQAVAGLRQRCPEIPVYGIIDRDFASAEALLADFGTHGILRTPRYTLENYLLDPTCWAAVFRHVFSRQRAVPDGWDQPEQVQRYIGDAFAACLDLAAHNMVIKLGCEQYPKEAATTREQDRVYRDHPNAFANLDPQTKLSAWGQQLGSSLDLGDVFRVKRQALQVADAATLHEQVSGKYVLKVLHGQFPRRPGRAQLDLDLYLVEYMRACPEPPADLAALLGRIIDDADHIHTR